MGVLKIRNAGNSAWIDVGGVGGMQIQDADGDTKIQCEESADEDIIRIDCGGTEVGILRGDDNAVLTITGRNSTNLHVKGVNTEGGAFKIEDDDGHLFGFGAFGREHAVSPSSAYVYCWKSSKFVQTWTEEGEVTLPNQPAFLYKMTSDLTILVNTQHEIVFDDKVFDQGDDVAAHKFTAPVTGRYHLEFSLRIDDIDVSSTQYWASITCSNRTAFYFFDPELTGDPAISTFTLSVLMDMDANDTAMIEFYQTGGAQVATVENYSSYFSGFLAC
jgi:hypothetical protein